MFVMSHDVRQSETKKDEIEYLLPANKKEGRFNFEHFLLIPIILGIIRT